MTRSQAVLLSAPGRLDLDEIELAPPGPGQVMVRMVAAGLCHTDLHIADSPDGWGRRFPILLGHEGSGMVEQVGSDAGGLGPGDRVAIACRTPCGTCPLCRRGDTRRCIDSAPRPASLTRSRDGESVVPALGVGLFAERVVVDARAAVRLDPAVPLELAAVLGCAVMTGVGAVVNTAEVFPGASVAVFGCGGIGLSIVLGALLVGAGRVIAVDVTAPKLEWARRAGATDVIDASVTDPVARVRELTGGVGVDFAFEAVGSPVCVEQAIQVLARCGVATIVGVPDPEATANLRLGGPDGLFQRTATVQVTHGGDSIPAHDLPSLAGLALAGRLDLGAIVTHRISLPELATGFERMRTAEAVRTIVVFEGGGAE